jgi:hypothetical protein
MVNSEALPAFIEEEIRSGERVEEGFVMSPLLIASGRRVRVESAVAL